MSDEKKAPEREVGPNVARLVARKMSLLAIPAGSGKDSFAIGLAAISNRERLSSIAAEARDWVRNAIALVKTAPDNVYGDDDEAIAGALLEGIKERESPQWTVKNR